MKILVLFLCLWTVSIAPIVAQTKTAKKSIKLDTIKCYDIGLEVTIENNSRIVYWANGKEIPESKYDFYNNINSNSFTKHPIVLRSYDEEESLLKEGLYLKGCYIGYYKEYYKNGNLKVTGSCKENLNRYWGSINWNGHCSFRNGEWKHYNEDGTYSYSEFWDNGAFINQNPEQLKPEVWKVEILRHGLMMDDSPISSDQLKRIEFKPYFKNSHGDSTDISIEYIFSPNGNKMTIFKNSLDSFKKFNLREAAIKNKLNAEDDYHDYFNLWLGNEIIYTGSINTKLELPSKANAKLLNSSFQVREDLIYYLVNSRDTARKIKLNKRYSCMFYYERTNLDLNIEEQFIYYYGHIVNLYPQDLILDLNHEDILTNYNNGKTVSTGINYYYYFYKSDSLIDNYRKISLENLDGVSLTSPTSRTFVSLGIFTTIFSAATSLIVAPLVSVNYKNNTFNKPLYEKVVIGGAIGFCIGIPIIAIASERRYKLTNKHKSAAKNLWYIDAKVTQ